MYKKWQKSAWKSIIMMFSSIFRIFYARVPRNALYCFSINQEKFPIIVFNRDTNRTNIQLIQFFRLSLWTFSNVVTLHKQTLLLLKVFCARDCNCSKKRRRILLTLQWRRLVEESDLNVRHVGWILGENGTGREEIRLSSPLSPASPPFLAHPLSGNLFLSSILLYFRNKHSAKVTLNAWLPKCALHRRLDIGIHE